MLANRKSLLRRIIILSCSLLIIGAIVALSCFLFKKKDLAKATPDAETVVTALVKPTDVYIYGDFVGRIKGQQFVEVRARVEGYLQKMLFSEGTYVKQGQTLFIIDPTIYKARANKARALLNKAKAQAQKASRDLARIRPLHAQNEIGRASCRERV